MRYLGVDFSGGAASWKARCSRPAVWVAVLDHGRLEDLRPVQDLRGEGSPFDRLVHLLAAGDFCAAGVDAPFCLPVEHLPEGGHRDLLERVGDLPQAPDRPFPYGAQLVELAVSVRPPETSKPLRRTELHWRRRGLNVRSSLWNGPRGGAPFASACLTLLARAGRPLWPWEQGEGMLVEAFPAAQLLTWGAPFQRYGGGEDEETRAIILDALSERVHIPERFRSGLRSCPDALDAVIACFGARAAALGRQADPPPSPLPRDGWISVETP